jgi:hypothetical protein
MIEFRNRVKQAWANIDVELKRRAELIPNIVRIVSSLAGHEQTIQTTAATLRSQLQVTAPGQSGADPLACGRTLTMLAEAYPTLVAHAQFRDLQRSLTTCEDRIALARAYFNDMATHLNTRIELFPDCFVAPLTGIRKQALMHDDGFDRNVPIVTL